ncbi:MAG: DUF1667 domain-containing protein [Treponema sp.]|nr:DUF1667 domain-containing protein [Treponema sp.]
MRSLTCIVCPIGCSLSVAEGSPGDDGAATLSITGNHCHRGAVYAQEEIHAPKRVVTATCGIRFQEPDEGSGRNRSSWAPQRVPVKTVIPCPKEKVAELLVDIYNLRLTLPVRGGDMVIPNWQGTGIDVIAVRSVG